MRSALALLFFFATAANAAGPGDEFPLAPADMRVPVRSGSFAIASDGNSYLVAFQDFREVGTERVRVARIGSDGRLLDSIPLAAAPALSGLQAFRRFFLVWDGVEYLLAWNAGAYELLRVAADGRALDPAPHAVDFNSDFPSVVWTGAKLLSMYPGGDGFIHARGIDPSGAQSEFTHAQPAGLTNWSSLLTAVWTSQGGVGFWDTQSPDGTLHNLSSLRFDSTWQPASTATPLGVGGGVIAAAKGSSAFVTWRDAGTCRAAVLDTQNTLISSCPGLDLRSSTSAIGIPGGFAVVNTSDTPFRQTGTYSATRFSDQGAMIDSKTAIDGLLANSPPLLASNGSSVAVVWESPTPVRSPGGNATGPLSAQLLSSNLDTIPSASSIALASGAPPELSADAACSGVRCGFAVIEERVPGQSSLVVGRITSNGAFIDGQGIELSGQSDGQNQPRMVFDGRDFVIVHVQPGNTTAQPSILSATRIGFDEPTPTASTLSDREITIASDVRQFAFAAASDRSGNTAVAWADGLRVCASVVTNKGATSPVCYTTDTSVSDPAVAFTGNEFVVAWDQLLIVLHPSNPINDVMGIRLNPDGTSLDALPHKLPLPTSFRTDLHLFAVQGKLVATWLDGYVGSLAGVRITPLMDVDSPPFRISFDSLPHAATVDAHGLTLVSLERNGTLQKSEYIDGQLISGPTFVTSQVSAAHPLRLIPLDDGTKLVLYGRPSDAAAGSLRSFARLLVPTRRRAARH